ncbi:MAG TPA: DNA translocase FtsK 4TM domain-containing protein, partial [Polyangiaceae bacterium LLY-WYZ-14_1]|nr:DNA translocase FtsK 4TM domain-containing protein [Polyangiaceae bacterium LLY-WYZ-14_1]
MSAHRTTSTTRRGQRARGAAETKADGRRSRADATRRRATGPSSSRASARQTGERRPVREILGLLAGAGALLLGMALGSSLRPPLPPGEGSGNWVGPVGAAVAESLTHAFGWAAWLIVLEAALASARLFRRRPSPLGWALPPVLVSSLFLGSAFLHLVL